MRFDMHAHILPMADHGSDSVETSLAQLRLAKAAGVDVILATPHFYLRERDTIPAFLARRARAMEALQTAIAASGETLPHVILGAEVTLQVDMDKLPDLEQLCIADTNFILLEMPDYKWSGWVHRALDAIYQRGLRPIIAHLDRYDHACAEALLDTDNLIQVNASAFCPLFLRGRWRDLVARDLVHFIGSDIHGRDPDGYASFTKAMRYLGPLGDQLMQNAAELLAPVTEEDELY